MATRKRRKFTPQFKADAGRLLRALLAAFAGLTGGWMMSALLVPGDDFDLLEPRVLLLPAIAGLLGGYTGFRARARWQYALLAISVALSVAFWALAPSGWSATRPPAMRGTIVVPR